MIFFTLKRSNWSLLFAFAVVLCFEVRSESKINGTVKNVRSAYAGSCALLLNVPGKSSVGDYNRLNLFGIQNNYQGSGTCITYGAVNDALRIARNYISVSRPQKEWTHDELATVGELFLEVSRIIAKNYGLSAYQIIHKLPLLDTSHTDLIHYCPDYLSPVKCYPGRYRRHDALCNNLEHPTWGARLTTFNRLISPVYTDGISSPRIGHGGYPLPNPRQVSALVHNDEGYHDHAATLMVVAWGQFMDHDFTLQGTPLDPGTKNEFEDCCHKPTSTRSRYCMNLEIPPDDYFYSRYGVTCQDFVRAFPGVPHGCRLGARSQFNLLTATIDGNTVYGTSDSGSRELRAGYGGLLRMNKIMSQYGLKDLLPPRIKDAEEGCARPNKDTYCFLAGEIRVNEQLILTTIHTLMAREHNRIATQLSVINPHWDDDQLYHEARHIVIAIIQHITYNEFLPVLLGKEIMTKFDLLLKKEGYWNGYDKTVNPGVLASFAAAAFRFGHSLLPTDVERWSKSHKYVTSTKLSDLIRKPFQLYQPGVLDQYYVGLSNQVAQAMDDFVTGEVTNKLFKKPGSPFGVDLASFNLQRGREFAIPGYMAYRRYCGLPDAKEWDDLLGSMTNETVNRYRNVYRHHEDIDLWSGGVVERSLPGSLLGPTFACIIATQFSNARKGDRFWYELEGQPSSFTYDQLSEIRKVRLARLICDNSDSIDTIQMYAMVLPDHEINPRVSCKSSQLPYMDLTKWADFTYPSLFQKSITTVRPLPYPYSTEAPLPNSKNGKYVPEVAFARLREALSVGRYSGYFLPPHQKPPLPAAPPGARKPLPTRRPVILSQEYVENPEDKHRQTNAALTVTPASGHVYFPTTILNKRIAEVPNLLNEYQPYSSDATVYRDLMTIVGALPVQEKTLSGFVPVEGPFGNLTMQELVQLVDSYIDGVDLTGTSYSAPNNFIGQYDLSILASENRRQARYFNSTREEGDSPTSSTTAKIQAMAEELLKESQSQIARSSSEEEKLILDEDGQGTTEKPLRLVRLAMVVEQSAKRRKREENEDEAIESELPYILNSTEEATRLQRQLNVNETAESLQIPAPQSSTPSLDEPQPLPLAPPVTTSNDKLSDTPTGVTPSFSVAEHTKAQQELNKSIEHAAEAMKAFDQSFTELQKALEDAKKFFTKDDPLLKDVEKFLDITPSLNITVVKPHDVPVFELESTATGP